MNKKKRQKELEDRFWSDFFALSVPSHLNEVPTHIHRANLRITGATDDSLFWMVQQVKTINQLDLDETDITNEGIKHLLQLESVKELRLKGCNDIDNDCLQYLNVMPSLELLHLGGTPITPNAVLQLDKLTNLKLLLISAEPSDAKYLEEIFVMLPSQCELLVNHKAYPFNE